MPKPNRVIKLPVENITVKLYGNGGSITGFDLGEKPKDVDNADAMGMDSVIYEIAWAGKDALFTMILAHAQAGIDVTAPEYLIGVQAVVDSIFNDA